jgi:L-lactate dehydrogenase complex protein LldF
LAGINRAKDLCQGETLCGACRDACPVNIDIPRMLRLLRSKLAEGDPHWNVRPQNRLEGWGYKIWAAMIQNRRRYELSMSIMRSIQHLLPQKNGMIQKLPPPFESWTRYRNIKPLARQSFSKRWQRLNPNKPC